MALDLHSHKEQWDYLQVLLGVFLPKCRNKCNYVKKTAWVTSKSLVPLYEEVALRPVFSTWFLHMGETWVNACIHRKCPFFLFKWGLHTSSPHIYHKKRHIHLALCGLEQKQHTRWLQVCHTGWWHHSNAETLLWHCFLLHKTMCKARRCNCCKSIRGTWQERGTRTGQQTCHW